MITFYNQVEYLKDYDGQTSLIITFDFLKKKDIGRLNFEVEDNFNFKVDNNMQGYVKISKFDWSDSNYNHQFNTSVIKHNLNILNSADYIKNICVQYSVGSDYPKQSSFLPDILFLEFVKSVPSAKSLTIYLMKYTHKDILHIMETLASVYVNIQELNMVTFRSDFPKELISFKNLPLKKIYLGMNQWEKKFPKFLYQFTSTLEELFLDYSIKELPKNIDKFECLNCLSIQDCLSETLPLEKFKNMKSLKAVRLEKEYFDSHIIK